MTKRSQTSAFGRLAYDWIRFYAANHRTFISEDCTQAAAKAGLEKPQDARAWGGAFRRAARDGVIRRAGYGVSLRRNQSPTPLWQSGQDEPQADMSAQTPRPAPPP